MLTNLKIHFHGVTPGSRGEIPISRDTPSRIFGSLIIPEALETPAGASVKLVVRSIRTLGGISVTVGSRVIPRDRAPYVPSVQADKIIDVSVQAEGETRTLEWSGGDLPNCVGGALLLVEVTFFDHRAQTQADGELLEAFLAINVNSAGAHGHDHGALTGLGDDDHTQYVLRSILTTNGDLFARLAGAIARLGIGSDGQVLTVASGAPSWATPAGGGGGFLSIALQVFDASGTYTPTTGMQYCIVIAVGGGGGGGGANPNVSGCAAGGGGGGGATALSVISAATIGASKAVAIGANGTGGSGTGISAGTTGGETTLGTTLVVAKGGVGGQPSGQDVSGGNEGGLGGDRASCTGDFKFSGDAGGAGLGSATNNGISGYGGGGFFAGRAQARHNSGSGGAKAGVTGLAYGGGGSGACGSGGDANSAAGGNGASGVIFILEFI